MDEEEYTPQPGDRCQLLGDFKVRHFDCDEHPDGTVTDVRTGEVITFSQSEIDKWN